MIHLLNCEATNLRYKADRQTTLHVCVSHSHPTRISDPTRQYDKIGLHQQADILSMLTNVEDILDFC